MADEGKTNDLASPDWSKWHAQKIVGKCKIGEFRSQDNPTRVIAILAEPADCQQDCGASIYCSLPVTDPACIRVRPSLSSYWGSSGRGPGEKYFIKPFPGPEVAVLHALRTEDPEDRRIAAIHFIVPVRDVEFTLNPEDSLQSLTEDKDRFREVADKWLGSRTSSIGGSQAITSAQKIVHDSEARIKKLKEFVPSTIKSLDKAAGAILHSQAVYKAIRDAAAKHGGPPLLSQVRDAFHDVAVEFGASTYARQGEIGNIADLKRFTEKPFKIELGRFDQTRKNLGFSWLPRSW